MDWKKLFGDAESLTLDELEKKVAGTKLVDLADGGYISKEKYDADTKKAKDAAAAVTKELEELKKASDGDEGLKKQVETLTTQLGTEKQRAEDAEGKVVRSERMAAVSAKVKDPKLARLALIDAEGLVTDALDFDAALAKVIADDPDYTPAEESTEGATTSRFRTGAASKGKPDEPDPLLDSFKMGIGDVETDE